MVGRRPVRAALLAVTVLAVSVWCVPAGGPAGVPGAGAAPSQADVEPGPGAPAGVLPPGGRWTVTLLTGEVVDVTSDDEGRVAVGVRAPSGAFRTVRHPDGDVHVIPLAVTAYYGRVLDPELFNVTGLVRQGYDDGTSPVVPVIVQGRPGAAARSTLSPPGGRPLPSIGAVAISLPKTGARATGELVERLAPDAGAGRLALDGVTRVWLDGQVRPASAVGAPAQEPPEEPPPAEEPPLDRNLTQVGAHEAWEAGWTGEGVRVAVLDTGVDASHPDLAGRIVAQEVFSYSPDTVDRHGHGTYVASLAAGSGAGSRGARPGVARGADLVVGKVFNDDGSGLYSQFIAGMEWAAGTVDATVVNMSLATLDAGAGDDPLSLAVDRLSEQHGTLFVVSAGNNGPLDRTVGNPGAADAALTVGAVDTDDRLAEFSSRGPVLGSFELKPEVLAPGVGIVAARAAGTAESTPVDDHYVRASGTSASAPQVAGAAAVLAQQHPDWTGDDLRNALIGSATPVEGDGYHVGAGRIDVGAATGLDLRVDRDVVESSLPHPRTAPHTETLTWTNSGDDPATVRLDAAVEDREGEPVDAASISPARLTVAPGRSASATLRIDGPALDPGLYSGMVTASEPGEPPVRTPLAVRAVPEEVELTVEATAPGGVAGADPWVYLGIFDLEDYVGFRLETSFVGDRLTVTVPAGRYAVIGDVWTGDIDNDAVAQVGDPDVTITRDTTVDFDGAAAVPFRPVVAGEPRATAVHSSSRIVSTPDVGGYGVAYDVVASYPAPPVRVTPMRAPARNFSARQVYRLQAPPLGARVGDEPVVVTGVPSGQGVHHVPAGTHTLRAVDVGDGAAPADFAGARDALALVQLPALDGGLGWTPRAEVAARAEEAGVAVLAYLDERLPRVTLTGLQGELPMVAAGGTAAAALRRAAAAGEDVTIRSTASPYVYDVVGPERDRITAEPEVGHGTRGRLATLDERFHRDPGGARPASGQRTPVSLDRVLTFDSYGPLPERRTAHVSPGVVWESAVTGLYTLRFEPWPTTNLSPLSKAWPVAYAAGSHHTLRWMPRPLRPGTVPADRQLPDDPWRCWERPVARRGDALDGAIVPFQDDPLRSSCAVPEVKRMTLERDGTVLGERESWYTSFALPADPGTYQLTYEQAGHVLYEHRSTTTWTFRSARPAGDEPAPIPLLAVDFQLPLDTLNRPTGRAATFVVDQVPGTTDSEVRRLEVWTSVDDGATWQPAPVAPARGAGRYRVTLPEVVRGTGVSLRVDAGDAAGSRLEQTLYDAYAG
jgi:subtilisin family serine protease